MELFAIGKEKFAVTNFGTRGSDCATEGVKVGFPLTG